MAKARVWKPADHERIGWDHPYIQITKTAPGYLVQELYGYADATWEQWLHRNKSLWTKRNRRPWIYLESLGRGSTEMDDDSD
ncbi:hypothetical protein [Rhodopirellula europaea]|uniref:hypothetical protein n=1 Tax=Rhodopirellula europaea TaxID=1263866 RepID=UPI003D2B610C|tara:strand:+ start:15573 stop:15818 length:246 start_codon:yes stop_codon:yes gene_type:complete